MDQRIRDYTHQLQQLAHGGNWLEESFDGKLRGLTADEGFTQPLPGVHSVGEIVWHCTYWRTVNIERMLGNAAYRNQTIERFNFLPLEQLEKTGWSELLDGFNKTQKKLIDLLQNKDDDFLMQEYEPGLTNQFIIEGTIHHDIYHLGQIGLVLKIIKVAANPPS